MEANVLFTPGFTASQDTTVLPFTWRGNLITVVGRGERVQEGINLTFLEGANF